MPKLIIDFAPQNYDHSNVYSNEMCGACVADEIGRFYRSHGWDVEYWIISDNLSAEQFPITESGIQENVNRLNEEYGLNIEPLIVFDEFRIKERPEDFLEYLGEFGSLEKVQPLLERNDTVLSCTAAETCIYAEKAKGADMCITLYPEVYGRLFRTYRGMEWMLSKKFDMPIFSFVYPNSQFRERTRDCLWGLQTILQDERKYTTGPADLINACDHLAGFIENGILVGDIPMNRKDFVRILEESLDHIEKRYFEAHPPNMPAMSIALNRINRKNGKGPASSEHI